MTARAHPVGEAQAPAHTVLAVPAMHCAGCMAKVERTLAALPGVHAARVNLTARSVDVTHAAPAGVPDLVAALAAQGFEAQPRDEPGEAPSYVRPLLAPLGVAAFACMNVMLLSVAVWSGADGTTRVLFHWISAAIGVPAIVYAGQPFFGSAWRALRSWHTNMDVPISIGVVLATALSFYETLTGGREAWFDGTLMLLLFLLAGRVLDATMRDRARAGVDALLRQAPGGAMVLDDHDVPRWCDSHDLVPGMRLRLATGERLAADGVLLAPAGRFDQSLLTGESAAVSVVEGGAVLAGTLNCGPPVDVRVTASGAGTALAEIAQAMAAAGQARSRYVRLADRAARAYAPMVHTLAAVTFVGWLIAGASLHQALVTAIAVLIITCPCALGLAVPVAQVVAAGALLRRGILVKDGSALERLAKVDRALIDKTGTLTLGRPVPDPAALAALSPDEARVALALASHSRHPLSLALSRALAAGGVRPATLGEVHEIAGRGVLARWCEKDVMLGRPQAGEGTATALAIGDAPVRLIRFADTLRPDTRAALDWLAALGVTPEILSGDNAAAVAEAARATGLAATSGASPADKLAAIAALQDAGHRVLMAGDGLNDGPALAAAHASIAPGSASDVGRQAADLVFTAETLLSLPRAVAGARATMRVVRQNFAAAIGYNLCAVPLAMAGMVTPLIAAVAMSTSSLVVIANSLRLARLPEPSVRA